MRIKQEILLLLVIAFLFLCIHHLSATSLGIDENVKEKDEERERAIAHLSKFGHGSNGGSGNGGTPAVSGGNGGSHSPNVQSGGGVTPLYAAAAGAGNNRHPHHGGGNRGKGGAGVEILAITTFAWFLLCVWFCFTA